MHSAERQRLLEQAKVGGFDDRHLAALEAILQEAPPTVLGAEVADIVVDKLKREKFGYFPQLPHIIMNASLLASHALADVQAARGGMDVFRTINPDAVRAAVAPLAQVEGQLAKITDSLAQVSQLLLGEDLDENTTKEEQTTWLTQSTEDSSPNRT